VIPVTALENSFSNHYLQPDWPAPHNVRAFSTTRVGGFSASPFESYNLAKHVQDDVRDIEKNRSQLRSQLNMPTDPYWLEQLHTTDVVDLSQKQNANIIFQADASCSKQVNQVCAIMTADCLPILITDKEGRWVAAIHAGWRGLSNGIIQNTIKEYPDASNQLLAWLGPAISQKHFEVGSEVVNRFISNNSKNEQYFRKKQNGKFMCDLYGIARSILQCLAVQVYGGGHCTFAEKNLFYSYRRDGMTGRMASLIWIEAETKT